MILCDESGLIKEIKSAASEVYDVTGAGDTSIAYLAAEISKGKDIETAIDLLVIPNGIYEATKNNKHTVTKQIEKEGIILWTTTQVSSQTLE